MREAYRMQQTIETAWLELEHAAELKTISELLDRAPKIYELAWSDLRSVSAARSEAGGAKGLSAEQVVRALVVKQMNGFSYRQLAFHLQDSRTYRTFCKLGRGTATPGKSSLAASIKALRPETLEAIAWLWSKRCSVASTTAGSSVLTRRWSSRTSTIRRIRSCCGTACAY